MIIRNFYDDRLAQASYLVGCSATGEAIVIDPLREIDAYLKMAEAQRLRIVAIAETHIHADYLSGSRELCARTGATMHLSDEGDAMWKYQFADDPKAKLVRHGDVIRIGNLSLKVLHTPGHTPEHICLLLTDHPAGEEPHSLFSGDFIFVGDVGRPDLLERAANIAGTMEKGARTLYQSLQTLADLPDSLLVWPAHGAGSACGKALGGSPVTSLGYERKTNWAFKVASEQKFVDEVLTGQPEPPTYFKEMKRLNKEGPRVLGHLRSVPHVAKTNFPLVDVREDDDVRRGYCADAIAIPSGKSLTNWAGWLLEYERPVTLVADSQEQADAAQSAMSLIGLDVANGWIHPTQLTDRSWVEVPVMTGEAPRTEDWLLDLRSSNEWNSTHFVGAHHIPLGYLPGRIAEVPRDRRVVVFCAGGGRSVMGVSILVQAGYRNVVEVPCGLDDLAAQCPTMVGSA